jgi:hypothetical protein
MADVQRVIDHLGQQLAQALVDLAIARAEVDELRVQAAKAQAEGESPPLHAVEEAE